MLLFLLASAGLQPDAASTRVATAMPATASVRLVRAAEFRLDRLAATEESLLRTAQVRERDGSLRPATLVEFY